MYVSWCRGWGWIALIPILCERAGKRKMGKEKESIDSVKGNAEETLGFGVFTLRDLKAGEEIVLGQWECGAYVTCAAEHSAYISVSFSIPLYYLLWVYRLYSTPSSPTTSPQEYAPPQPNGKHLACSFTSCARVPCAWGCAHSDGGVHRWARTLHAPLPAKRRAAVGESHVCHKWAHA